MELIVAILMFLQVLIPGKTYTQNDVNAIATQNQAAISAVQADPVSLQVATDTYTQPAHDLIEPWEDPLPDPVH